VLASIAIDTLILYMDGIKNKRISDGGGRILRWLDSANAIYSVIQISFIQLL